MSALKLRSFGRGKQRSSGFTLLEVMLAFVVFALSFATVLEIMAASMRSVRRAGDDTEVALLAQSVMDLVGTEIPVREGEFSGTGLDRFDWRLGIYLYASTEDDGHTQLLAEMSGIELYLVELDIDWLSGRRPRELHFSTIRSVLANRE